MMKCKEVGFEGCLCADCVYNGRYAINTPQPCALCDCDLCNSGELECGEVFCFSCSGHLTIEEVNARIEEEREV